MKDIKVQRKSKMEKVWKEVLELQQSVYYDRIEFLLEKIYINKENPITEAIRVKEEILNLIPDEDNYSQYSEFYDKVNENYKSIYKNAQMENMRKVSGAAITGAAIGIYTGYKKAIKRRHNRF